MDSLITRMNSNDLTAVLVVGSLFLTIGTVAIFALWVVYRRMEMQAALKMEMIRRGMSVEEIERVLEASPKNRRQRAFEREHRAHELRV